MPNLLLRSVLLGGLLLSGSIFSDSYAQMTATTTSTLNTNCNGTDCNYSGPSILINELMISPVVNDGSISGNGGAGQGRGEWIELYNPNLCEPVDISCYFLGNHTPEGAGGFIIPAGTIVPPAGFAMIRGFNVAPVPASLLVQNGGNVVEVVVPENIGGSVCADGSRLWFPNAGGWFAFYDTQGVPQDAVSWGTGGTAFNNYNYTLNNPCIPLTSGCNAGVTTLSSYSNIPSDRKIVVNTSSDAGSYLGQTLQRSIDGGAWAVNAPGNATYATCNGPCFEPGSSSCTGTATVTVTGGVEPYSYLWDDSQAQLTQTAIELCAGEHCVTVTDANASQVTVCVTIADFVPDVQLNIQDNICINAATVNMTSSASPQAGAGETGLFSGTGVTGANFNPSNAGTGNHVVTYVYTDASGCTNSATDNITVNPLPTGSITGIQSPYCNSSTPVTFTLQPAGGTLLGAGVNPDNSFTPSTAGIGTHALTYQFTDANGCSNTASAPVTVVDAPEATLTMPEDICIYNDPITLTGNPAGGTFTVEGNTTDVFDPNNAGAGEHTVSYSYTDAQGCTGTTEGTITVHPRPSLSTDLSANYCFGTTAAALNPTPAGGSLTGDFVTGTSLDLSGTSAGSYGISYFYTDEFGCENTLDENYTVSPPLHPKFDYSVNCAQIVSFVNQTSLNVSNLWTFDNGTTASVASPAVPFTVSGNHSVDLTVTDAYGCSYDTTQVIFVKPGTTIEEIMVANVITANGDNVNDYIEFPEDFLECYEYTMYIVNRWGQTVFEMSNSNNRFYGKDKNGKNLDAGVYFYVIESPQINCDDPMWQPFCSGNITVTR